MRSFPLAEYEQRAPIRIGSLSQCFSAQRRGGEVLLKQLLPAFARVPSVAAAWLQCAEENSRFDHPGCLQVLDWGEALGEAYLALPAVPVWSLRELLASAGKGGTWPSAQAVVSIATDALITLAYVHGGFELAHLDLDPHALLLRKDGSLLLTEFGMWRALPPEAATRERFDRGRVAYLSPELTKSLPGDARSDVFSLGAILYELLGKQRPFQGATQLVTAMAIAEGRRRPLRELAPQAPELLCEIVETMLAQKPEERFQSAPAALAALSSSCEGDRAAVAAWIEASAPRTGPMGGAAREQRSLAVQAPAAQPLGQLGEAARHVLGAPNSGAYPSPLPPPLLAPPAQTQLPDPPQDDWLAPPPLLSPGAPALAGLAAGGPAVRDGSTAFIDTGAARQALAQAGLPAAGAASAPALMFGAGMADVPARNPPTPVRHVASHAPGPPAPGPGSGFALPAPPELVAAPRSPPSLSPLGPAAALGSPPSAATPQPPPSLLPLGPAAALGAPAGAPPRPMPSASAPQPLAAPSPASKPLRTSLPPLEADAPWSARQPEQRARSGDQRGWQEPSKTVFQAKAFAKSATRGRDARSPLLVTVLLSVAFGFAVVAGLALLWRLFGA